MTGAGAKQPDPRLLRSQRAPKHEHAGYSSSGLRRPLKELEQFRCGDFRVCMFRLLEGHERLPEGGWAAQRILSLV